MPDYDKIHDGPGPYQKPCKQMQDGMPIELVADSLLRPIISTLKYYGDDSISTLLQVSDYLNELPGPLFSNTIDWASISKAIDQIIEKSSGKISAASTQSLAFQRDSFKNTSLEYIPLKT